MASRIVVKPEFKKQTLRSVVSGEIKIAEITIGCHVLSDGSRLLVPEQFKEALDLQGHDAPSEIRKKGFLGIPETILSFASSQLAASARMIRFVLPQGGIGHGIEARLLPLACDAYVAAWEAGKTHHKQERVVRRCISLLRAFAIVGIEALIDEATGYQRQREADALRTRLTLLLRQEAGQWEHTFPEAFYEGVFRLKGMTYSPEKKRGCWLANLTNEIVYSRLDTGILEALNLINPIMGGRTWRRSKQHQHLTPELGRAKLNHHINTLITLMKSAVNDWDLFVRLVDMHFPKCDGDAHQIEMFSPLFSTATPIGSSSN